MVSSLGNPVRCGAIDNAARSRGRDTSIGHSGYRRGNVEMAQDLNAIAFRDVS